MVMGNTRLELFFVIELVLCQLCFSYLFTDDVSTDIPGDDQNEQINGGTSPAVRTRVPRGSRSSRRSRSSRGAPGRSSGPTQRRRPVENRRYRPYAGNIAYLSGGKKKLFCETFMKHN